jgi:hypothetical protein
MPPVAAPIAWWQDDPGRLDAECAAMAEAAPDLNWVDARFAATANAAAARTWFDAATGGWFGEVPLWPFDRPRPRGLGDLVGGRPLLVAVQCWPVHPMMAPIVTPLGVPLPLEALGLNTWHLVPSGALCLFRGDAWWDPASLVAELVPKISGWYIEYHLMMRGCITRMPDRGVNVDDALDQVIDDCVARRA